MTRPIDTVEPGVVLLERYELRERLGRGAASPVWRAHDLLLRRDVALRILRTSTECEPERARERAHHESRAAARFQHPALASIYDIAELDGDVVLVTELLRGLPLDRVLAARGPLTPALVARVGAHLAAGLAVAHAHGVVHGHVGPGTVLLGLTEAGEPDGTAALADLGIARLDAASAHGAPGTPADDLWAVGATLRSALGAAGAAGPLGALLAALRSPDPTARPDAARARIAFETIRDAVDAVDAVDAPPDHAPAARHRAGPRHDDGEALTAPQPRLPAAVDPPPTRTWTPTPHVGGHRGRSASGPRRHRRLVGAGVVGAGGLLVAGAVGVVTTAMTTPTPTDAATVAAAPEAPVLPPPAPAVDPPIVTPDPGPAITAVPMDGAPLLSAAVEDTSSDQDDDRSERERDRGRDDDRSERKRDRDRDDDRSERKRDRDRSDRDGDRDRSDRDNRDRDRGDSDDDRDEDDSDDD